MFARPGSGVLRCEARDGRVHRGGRFRFLCGASGAGKCPARIASAAHAGRGTNQVCTGRAPQLWNAPGRNGTYCASQFLIAVPHERVLMVRGGYSALWFSDTSRGVDAETTHGRITLLNVGLMVIARAIEGVVDYSGHEGIVRL